MGKVIVRSWVIVRSGLCGMLKVIVRALQIFNGLGNGFHSLVESLPAYLACSSLLYVLIRQRP